MFIILSFSCPAAGRSLTVSPYCSCICIDTEQKWKVLTVFVNGGDCSVPLNVSFRPTSAERFVADIYISIRHNIYEDSVVQLIGEGYVETVTIDDVSCSDDFDPPLMPPAAAAAVEEGAEEDEEDTPGLSCCCCTLHWFPVVLKCAGLMQL